MRVASTPWYALKNIWNEGYRLIPLCQGKQFTAQALSVSLGSTSYHFVLWGNSSNPWCLNFLLRNEKLAIPLTSQDCCKDQIRVTQNLLIVSTRWWTTTSRIEKGLFASFCTVYHTVINEEWVCNQWLTNHWNNSSLVEIGNSSNFFLTIKY